MLVVKEGKYRHFKGATYEVLYTATHTESEERLVVYRLVGEALQVWARPVSMFFDTVTDPQTGEPVRRFERVDD